MFLQPLGLEVVRRYRSLLRLVADRRADESPRPGDAP